MKKRVYSEGVYSEGGQPKTTSGQGSLQESKGNGGTNNSPLPEGKRRPQKQFPRWAVAGLVALAVGLLAFFLVTSLSGNSEPKPISTISTSDIHSLAFSPSEPDTIFFGSHSGLLKSRDSGRTWQQTSLTKRDAMGLGMSPDGNVIYLGGHSVLLKSADGGQTWQSLVEKIPATDVHGLAVDPANPANLYIFVFGAGLLKSVDGGQTWQVMSAQAPDSTMNLAYGNQTLWLGTMDKGLLRSKDNGKTFESANGSGTASLTGMVSALAFDQVSKLLYAGTGEGLFRSPDGGASWSKLGYSDGVGALAVSPTNSKLIMLVRPAGEVYRSEDGGLSWPGK